MADFETDPQIDGKSLYSLRVVDLKQELKKRDIGFKANATKAQLQGLLIDHLKQTIDTIEDKSSEDNSRTTIQSEDTNETLESLNDTNNVHSFRDNNLHEDQSDSAITSSVSFGDHSIKLKIKLQPNDSPNRQLSPKKSPTKELRSPVIEPKSFEDVLKPIIEDKPLEQCLPQVFAQDLSRKDSSPQKTVEEVIGHHIHVGHKSHKTVPEVEVIKHDIEVKVRPLPVKDKVLTPEKTSLPSSDTKEMTEEPKIISESKDIIQSSVEVEDKDVNKSEKTESSVSESNVSIQTPSEVVAKESIDKPIAEPITEKTVEKVEKKTEPEKPKLPRRRRWGSVVTNDPVSKGISSDQLKELIPDLDSTTTGANDLSTSKVSKSDVNTSLVVTSSQLRTHTTDANTEYPSKRDIRVVRKSLPEEAPISAEESASAPKAPVVEQKQKIVVEFENKSDEQQQDVRREVTASVKPESTVVFIQNLVRPFTLLQLKDVLGKTGKLIEERFWIDKIKSKCYATYDTIDEAVATRLALNGIRWPSSNPKLLSVDFSTPEELDTFLNEEIGFKRDLIQKQDQNVGQKHDIVIKSDDQKRDKENKTENRAIREWDRDKLTAKEDDRRGVKRRAYSPAPRSRSQERDPKRRRQDSTKGEEQVRPADTKSREVSTTEAAHGSESPAKLLDDLFRKTIATPSIYWLPLTEEQVIARDALRAEDEKRRLEERNARQEMIPKEGEERRFDPPFRSDRMQRRSVSPPNRRNFGNFGNFGGRPPPRRSPQGRWSPFRRRSPPPNRFSRSRSRSPFNRKRY